MWVWVWSAQVGPDIAFALQRGRWQCEATLHGEQGHPWGRFGAALTVLGDVNGDNLADVAIGAPGEEESRGAVYVFHGASRLEISPSPSQVRHRCQPALAPSLSPCLGLAKFSLCTLARVWLLFSVSLNKASLHGRNLHSVRDSLLGQRLSLGIKVLSQVPSNSSLHLLCVLCLNDCPTFCKL